MKEFSRSQKIILSAGFVVLVTLLLIALSKDLIVSANRNASLIKTPGLPGPFADEISRLETNIARSPNEEVRRGEEKRLQMVGREATMVAEARNAEATNGLPTPVPTQLIKLTVQVFNETQQAIENGSQQQWGLIDHPSVPMSGMVFHPENAWKQDMGDGYILIIAGYSPNNPDQGLLFVTVERNNLFTSRTFIAPGNGGSIRIEKAVGMRLVLKTAGQDILYFDIPGLRFVDSLEEVVPTATEPIRETTPVDIATPIPLYP